MVSCNQFQLLLVLLFRHALKSCQRSSTLIGVSIGVNIIQGIGSGIASAVSGLVGQAIQACKSLASSVKSFFGIASPSKLFKGYGKYLDEGLAIGITDNLGLVENAIGDLEDATIGGIDTNLNFDSNARVSTNGGMERVISLLEQLVANPTIIEMNDRELGRSLKRMGVEFA